MRTLNVLLSILVSLLIGLGIFEFGLGRMPAFRDQVRLNRFDENLGWSKKPNHSGRRSTSEFDIHFSTNTQGLREPADTPKQKPKDTLRVLMLGDSFVLGYTVEERDTFASQLEKQWRAEGRAIEVINAGCEGYSSDQEALWFLNEGLSYAPDLVLLFPYENDIYWNSQSEYNGSPKPLFNSDGKLETNKLIEPANTRPWYEGWATGRFLQFIARQLIDSHLSPARGFETAGAKGRILKEFAPLLNKPPAFIDDCLQRTRGSLSVVRDACQRAGIRLMMLPIPSESCIHPLEREAFRISDQGLCGLADDQWSPDRPVETFLSMGAELGIPTLDARAALREAGAEEALYFKAEWHLNPAGNRALAGYLHHELDRLSVIPGRFGAGSSSPSAEPSEGNQTPPWRYLLFGSLWILLGSSYRLTYSDEALPAIFLKVGLMLAFAFSLVLGSSALLERHPALASTLGLPLVLGSMGFLLFKLGRRVGTILELVQAFALRGHWYLMPVLSVLLSIGSLLVVAASSPLIAPFIYTLF